MTTRARQLYSGISRYEALGILSAGALPLVITFIWFESPSNVAIFGSIWASLMAMISYHWYGVRGGSSD